MEEPIVRKYIPRYKDVMAVQFLEKTASEIELFIKSIPIKLHVRSYYPSVEPSCFSSLEIITNIGPVIIDTGDWLLFSGDEFICKRLAGEFKNEYEEMS